MPRTCPRASARDRHAYPPGVPGRRTDRQRRAGGDTISPFYDPMIAKVITHGPTRAIALARMTQALDASEVAGSVTNLSFLAALTRHAGFAGGDVDTGLIERDLEALTRVDAVPARVVAQAGFAAAGLMEDGDATGFTLWSPLARSVFLERDGEETRVVIRLSGPEGPRSRSARTSFRPGAPRAAGPSVRSAPRRWPGPATG